MWKYSRRSLLILVVMLVILAGTLSLFAQTETTTDFDIAIGADGYPVVTLTDATNIQWVQVWVGSPSLEGLHLQWYELASAATCEGLACAFPVDFLPSPDDYVMYIQPWGPNGFISNGSSGWLGPVSFAVTEWPPNRPSGDFFTITDDLGQLMVVLNDYTHIQWVQAWVGDANGQTRQLKWFELATDAECGNGICTVPLQVWPGQGQYTVYIQPWGSNGFAQNTLGGWFGPSDVEVAIEPPANVTNLRADGLDLLWNTSQGALYYQVWVGNATTGATVYQQWHEGSAIGCNTGLCTIRLTGNFNYGQRFNWSVQAWGPGGFSGNGTASGWAQGPDFMIGSGEFAFGGQVDWFTQEPAMRDIGMRWVKRQIKFEYGQSFEDANRWINRARAGDYHLLLGIVGNREQLAADPTRFIAEYTTFVSQVAALMDDGSAIEVWNEPNLEREWPRNWVSGANYVLMLRPAYQAIKAVNPSIMVISAAPAPTGVSIAGEVIPDNVFIQQVVAAGGTAYMDCVGVHYNEGTVPPADRSGDPRGTHHSYYYPAMVDLYASVFPTKPLCFTELGYIAGEDVSSFPPGFDWGFRNSLDEHARWLADAAYISREDPRVRMMIVWNVDFTFNGADPMFAWSMFRPSGACPSCATIKALFNP